MLLGDLQCWYTVKPENMQALRSKIDNKFNQCSIEVFIYYKVTKEYHYTGNYEQCI